LLIQYHRVAFSVDRGKALSYDLTAPKLIRWAIFVPSPYKPKH